MLNRYQNDSSTALYACDTCVSYYANRSIVTAWIYANKCLMCISTIMLTKPTLSMVNNYQFFPSPA